MREHPAGRGRDEREGVSGGGGVHADDELVLLGHGLLCNDGTHFGNSSLGDVVIGVGRESHREAGL